MDKGIALEFDGTLRRGEQSVRLTGKEVQIVLALASRGEHLTTKDSLFTELYGGRDEPEMKIVDVFVCKVRTKLRSIGVEDAIRTVWGLGYTWNAEYPLAAIDSGFVSFEVSAKTLDRLDRLTIARDQTMQELLTSFVLEALPLAEKEVWK